MPTAPATPAHRDLAPARWQAVLTRIEENSAANLAVEELAAAAGISPSCFARLFKQRTGLTVCNYVIRRRVEKARQLILDHEMDLADIASVVGFADQAHLTRHFKRFTGMTPAQFCKQHRPGKTAGAGLQPSPVDAKNP